MAHLSTSIIDPKVRLLDRRGRQEEARKKGSNPMPRRRNGWKKGPLKQKKPKKEGL